MTLINEAPEPPRLEPGDALFGGQAIADYVNELLGTDVELPTIYGWIYRHKIPAGKFGAQVIGSRKAIAEKLARDVGLAA